MTVLLSDFLIALGLLQLTAVYFGLRGLSLTGRLWGPGILVGILAFTVGVWIALDQTALQLVLWGVPSAIMAVIALVVAGVITNLTWDPSARFMKPEADADWTLDDVMIPVQLTHIAQGSTSAVQTMPATYMRPKSPGAGGQSRPGSAVLVVCGAGDNRMSFKRHLFRALLKEGMSVLTIDPPGNGDFQHVPMTVANARAATKASLDWLSAQPGVSAVGACGISFGGNQVASLAAEDARIRALALISTPVHLASLTRGTYIKEAVSLVLWPRNAILLQEGSVLTLLREWSTLKGIWCGESLYDMIERFDTRAAIGAVGDRPKLFVHGTRDVAIPATNSRILYSAATPERELLLIRQATHISPVLFPAAMRHMAAWFRRSLNYNRGDAQQVV